MLKIGVISSSMVTAERTIRLAESTLNPATHQYRAFVYNSLEEIHCILAAHAGDVDGWLFTGPNPYYAVRDQLPTEDNIAYGQTTGLEVYKYLLEYMYETHREKLRVSVDCPQSEGTFFQEALSLLEIPVDEIYFQQYTMPYDVLNIVAQHERLWQAHKVDVAFTTLHSVQMQLEKRCIPCKRIEVSRSSRRQAICTLEQKMTGLSFRNSQLGMICIEIKDYDEVVSRLGNYYKLQQLELRISARVLDFCQKIDGYLAEKANGRYEIFASRGFIEKYGNELQDVLTKLQFDYHIGFLSGVGLAATVYGALLNAHKALANARRDDKLLVMVAEDGKVVEAFGTNQEIRYQAETDEPLLTARLRKANVAIQTYSRIVFIVRKMGWSVFTAAQLAQQLNVTSRNIQRILAGLKKASLVLETGQESLSRRGRPAKMYRLL